MEVINRTIEQYTNNMEKAANFLEKLDKEMDDILSTF